MLEHRDLNRDETLSNNSFSAAQNSASQVWWYQGNCRISLGILGAKQHSTDTAVELYKSTLHLVRVYRKILFEFYLNSDLYHFTEFVWVCIWVGFASGWFHAETWFYSWNMKWTLTDYFESVHFLPYKHTVHITLFPL